MALHAIRVIDKAKNEAQKKMHFESNIKCFKEVKIDKWLYLPYTTHFPHRLLC